jgi:hypothetical protein
MVETDVIAEEFLRGGAEWRAKVWREPIHI